MSNVFFTNSAAQNCSRGCSSSIGPLDPLNKAEMSPRKSRERIREQIKDAVMLNLGAPQIQLELDEQQLDLAVDQALMVFEDYCPQEYFQYYTFRTIPGQSVYKMPADVGIIRDVFYKETPNFAFSGSDLGGVLPLEYMYPGGSAEGWSGGMHNPAQPVWGRMGEWTLYKQYEMMYSRSSSQIGGWEWLGGHDHIKLYPIPYGASTVMVHYLQRQPDFKQINMAMIEGALAFAKIMLGRIRTRIMNPPGPGGGLQLDGQIILEEGKQEKKEWEERLLSRYGGLDSITWG